MRVRPRWLALAVLLSLPLALLSACGGDDDDGSDETTPTASPTAALTSTTQQANTSPTASPSASATVSPAQVLARSPQYVIYVAGEGDTVQGVADAFDAAPGAPPAEFVERIRTDNKLTSDDLEEGQEIAVPVVLPGDLSMFAENSIEAALGVGTADAGKLVLLQPSLDMRSGFLGKLVLHRVRLATAEPDSEGRGYIMEYWLADRPPVKGGSVDPDAQVSDPQFIVAAGSLVDELESQGSDGLYRFERDGVQYALKANVSRPSPMQLANMLQTAAER
ncbi:MAG: hypothetical protein ACM3S1_16890 [Hyphomicrobiales bacterium]